MKMIAFGDSVMKGIIPDPSRAKRYMISEDGFIAQCMRKLRIPITNYGRFGSTVKEGEKLVDRHIELIGQADYTLLEYGGNDCDFDWKAIAAAPEEVHNPRTPLQAFSAMYTGIIQKIRASGSCPLMLSLPPLISERYFRFFSHEMNDTERRNIMQWLGNTVSTIGEWHELYNLEVFKIASRMSVKLIDITSIFYSRRKCPAYISEDGIHPNAAGHQIIARTVYRELATLTANAGI